MPNNYIIIKDLIKDRIGIGKAMGEVQSETCRIRLDEANHHDEVEINVRGDYSGKFKIVWEKPTGLNNRTHNDDEWKTEQAAIGISVLLIEQLTDFVVVERSRKGTGFDYWLGKEIIDSDPPFSRDVRLEVSGIKKGSNGIVTRRVKEKLEQTTPTDSGGLPALISVVEFSKPLAIMERKKNEFD